jgi:hypothetical protein
VEESVRWRGGGECEMERRRRVCDGEVEESVRWRGGGECVMERRRRV